MGRQLRLKLERREGFHRDDFVASQANAEALRLLDVYPAWPLGALALVGPAGAGKSHLSSLWARRNGASILRPIHVPSPLPQGPVLMEDIDRGFDAEALFHLINRAAESGGLLVTARTPPSQWMTDLPDLRSRLNALSVAALEEPDDEILVAVFEKFFRERNIKPSDDLIPYLLNRIERSVPKALEIVMRLDETADAEGKPVSRALARQILDAEPPTLNLFE